MQRINVLSIQRISAEDRAKIEAVDPAIELTDAGGHQRSMDFGHRQAVMCHREASMRFLLSMVILLGLAAPAWSQIQTVEREYKGAPDRDIQVGVFVTIRPDCTSGPLPAIRLAEPPAHGRVTVKSGKLRATNIRQCLGTEVPAFVAIYRAQRDFTGTDVFTLEVKSAQGRTEMQKIRVNVAPASGQQL